MSEPVNLLQRRVAAIGRQVRRMLVAHGLSWVVGIAVVASLSWALLDTWLRFDDHGVRLIGSLVVLAAIGWAVWRFLLPAIRQPLGDVLVAQRIERHFEGLGDQLSSSIEFLQQSEDDPCAGSATLRRAAVAEVESRARMLDWSRALDRRPVIKVACAAAVVCMVAAALAVRFPRDARLALVRLAMPWGSDAWPPANDLVFTRRVDRITRDQAFEVELADRNHRLPDEVRIEYRSTDEQGATRIDAQRMQRIGDVMVARRDKIVGPFDYRATGGDDRKMAWIHVDVVEPPEFASVQIRLHPPAYTAWCTQSSPRRIVALRGTTIEVAARSSKRLASATLHQPGGPDVPMQLSKDGRQWVIPATASAATAGWTVDKSGPYWFELRDSEAMVGGLTDRWDLQAVADQPPTVTIESPLSNLAVTPGATLALKILAKDDLALKGVALVYTRSDRSELGEVVVPLWNGPPTAAAQPPSTPPSSAGSPADALASTSAAPQAVASPAASGELSPGVSRTLEYTWQLAPLNLPPGTQLLMTAIATDYLPQKGVSPPRRLAIITPAELEDRLAQRQSLVFSELGRILKLEQAARQQTSTFATQLERVGRFQKQDLDQLRGAELNQRQIHGSLTGRAEGVRNMVASLLEEISLNHVENPAMRRRMQCLADELTRLDTGELSAAERDLTRVVKGAQDATGGEPRAEVGEALAAAGRDQEAVATALERMLGDLAEWNSFRGLARELTQIRRDLTELTQATKDLGAHTLTQDFRELTSQQQADLKKLSSRQLDQARDFDRLEQRLERVSNQLRESDPLASGSLADALHVARRQGPGSLLRDAGEQVGQNRIGQALEQQTAAGRVLDEMLDVLSNRPEQELSRLVAKLRSAEGRLADVRKEEEGLRKKLHEAAAAGNSGDDAARQAELKTELERLAALQRQLQEETAHLTHELQRLQAGRAAAAAARAASHMTRAAQGAEHAAAGTPSGAAAESNVAEAAAAVKDLAEAEQQVAQARRQAEADLAHEQLQRLDDSIKSLVDRQKHMNAETVRLEKLRVQQTNLTRGQAEDVLKLGREQADLSGETNQLGTKLAGAAAYQFLLRTAAGDMTRTADRLAARDTGTATQQLEQDVLTRLEQLVQALAENKSASKPSGGAGDPTGGDGQGAGQRRSLGEVRLIQLMQEDLNRRTQRLSRAIGSRDASDDERRQFGELTHEQQQLAELIQSMAGEADEAAQRAGDEQSQLGDDAKDAGNPK